MSIVQSNLFNPTLIPTCQLWLDAADTSTMTLSGNNVSQWSDKSGNARHATQATSTRRPVLTSNQINGLPAIKWDGVDDNLAGSLPYPSTGQTTVFIVYNPTIINNEGRLFDINGNTYGNVGVHWTGAGSPDILLWFGTGSSFTDAKYTQATASIGIKLASVLFNGTSSLIWRDGNSMALSGNGNFITPTGTTYTLGNSSSGTNSGMYTGYIAEVLFYSRNLSTSEREQTEGYLAWKWNLVSTLPANHPYKSVPAYSVQPFPLVRGPSAISSSNLFAPSAIQGCTVWLDAADTSSMTFSGSNVLTLADKALGNSMVGGATKPTLTTFQSYPSLLFNGSASMTASTNLSFANTCTNAANFTCFMVQTTSSSTGVNGLSFNVGYVGSRFAPFTNSTGGIFFDAGQQGDPRLTGLSQTMDTRGLQVFSRRQNNTVLFRGNGTQTSSFFANPANFTNQTHVIYMSFASWTGFMNEVVYYNRDLTTSDIEVVEGYLAWKWGLTNSLVAGHPYKTTPVYSAPPFPTTVAIPRIVSPTFFLPTSIPLCQLWLDATDTASITFSGSTVTQWNDKTVNGNHAESTGTITRAAVINGRQAMVWGPSAFNTYFRGLCTNTGPTLTAFAVFNMNSGSYASARVVSLGAVGQTDYNNVSYAAVIEKDVNIFNAHRNSVPLSQAPIVYDTSLIICSEFTGAKHTLYMNGVGYTPVASTGNFTTQVYQIGSSLGEEILVNYQGFIGEVIMFPTLLTTNQRISVEGYLAWKWGLQSSLPASHPFKAFPPI